MRPTTWGGVLVAGLLLSGCSADRDDPRTAPSGSGVGSDSGSTRTLRVLPPLCDAASSWSADLRFSGVDPLPAEGAPPVLGPRMGYATPVDAVWAVADAALVLGSRGGQRQVRVPVLAAGGEPGTYRVERVRGGWRVSGGTGCGAQQGAPDDGCHPTTLRVEATDLEEIQLDCAPS